LASPALFGAENNVALGFITDGVYLNGTGIELTTTWTALAGYEHSWAPTLKTSITGGYSQVVYNNTATAMFAATVCQATAGGGQISFNTASHCDPTWGYFQGGIRTQWSPVNGFFMGVETQYTQIFTAFKGTATLASSPVGGARPAGVYNINDQGIWSAIFRAGRSFNTG